MTREEAIAILEVSKHMATSGRLYNQAIDLAIESLSAEAAYRSGWNGAIECIIENAPFEEKLAEREWIPCSERLPDKDGWYLITVQGYEKVVDMEWYYGEWGAWNGVSSEQQVIAWMPLPKPYKGGDSE